MPENTEQPPIQVRFFTVNEEHGRDPEDYESNGCTCPPGDTRFVLEIEEGSIILKHAACGKNPPDSWGDCWTDDIYMHPIPVAATYKPDCDGQMWHGMERCEDGATLTVHPNACSDPVECAHEAAVGQARETARRLNRRAQALESEIAAYRRAVGLWEITEKSTYVPLHSLGLIAKAADRSLPVQWEMHGQRMETHRLNLSLALGLGTGAPWEAIHERSRERGKTAATSEAYSRLGGPTPPPRGTGYGPSAEELAAHLADQPMSVLQGAFRILGMRLDISVVEDPECSASLSGSCLRESESETACDTESGECVHDGRPGGEAQQDETCTNCRGSGLDPRYSAGDFACPDCSAAAVSQSGKERVSSLAEECCGAVPPERLTGPNGEDWGTPGDCWCTLRPHGREVDHLCEPCAERTGMPPWKDDESLPEGVENAWCACSHQRSEHSAALFQPCRRCVCLRFYVAVPCVRPDVHPEHLHSGIRNGVTVHGKCPGVKG